MTKEEFICYILALAVDLIWIAVKIGDEVIVDGYKGIIIRDPYKIGNHDDPLFLVLVWYGCYMGDAKLQDIQPTGKKYPEIVKIIEELKGELEAENE